MDAEYQEAHLHFVSNNNGSSIQDILLAGLYSDMYCASRGVLHEFNPTLQIARFVGTNFCQFINMISIRSGSLY